MISVLFYYITCNSDLASLVGRMERSIFSSFSCELWQAQGQGFCSSNSLGEETRIGSVSELILSWSLPFLGSVSMLIKQLA